MPQSSGRAAILEGHRRLLEGFREFRLGAEQRPPWGAVPDLDDFRAAVAYLRQEVLPFSRWEERMLASDPDRWEAASFEHAFLAVEIDRLAGELGALYAAGRRALTAASLQRLLRRAQRIEAVLELHTLRAEDGESLELRG